jgi:endonuclease/exonuclease/phosphatase family metal-dependent hydrolase
MNLSLLTYNTLFNNAVSKLNEVVDIYHPDIICLQEALTDDISVQKIEKLGYKMADYSNSFVKFGIIFGVITFYNPSSLVYKESVELKLGTNPIEYLLYFLRIILGHKNQARTILETDFIHKFTKKKISICNVHLYVVGTNDLRIKHIDSILKSINLSGKKQLILVGDFNYFPYKRRNLEKMMIKYNLHEATANIRQTMKFTKDGKFEKYNFFQRFLLFINKFFVRQIKTDYSFYRGLKLIKTERIESETSDHYPIISYFSI